MWAHLRNKVDRNGVFFAIRDRQPCLFPRFSIHFRAPRDKRGQDGTTYGRTNEKETSKDTERWARHMGGHGDNKTRAKKREQVEIAGGGGRRGGGGKQGEGERKKSGGEGDNMWNCSPRPSDRDWFNGIRVPASSAIILHSENVHPPLVLWHIIHARVCARASPPSCSSSPRF